MNTEEVSAIETHLKLKLPSKYRETLLAGYCVDPYFLQDPVELLIEHPELRMYHVKDAFAGGSWPDSYFCIGNDGCGDHSSLNSTPL